MGKIKHKRVHAEQFHLYDGQEQAKYPRRIEVRIGVTRGEIVEEGAKKPTTFYWINVDLFNYFMSTPTYEMTELYI